MASLKPPSERTAVWVIGVSCLVVLMIGLDFWQALPLAVGSFALGRFAAGR
jgi:hypothetical protein